MASDRWRRITRWARRRRTPLIVGGVAALALALAVFFIYRAATDPVVGEVDGDASAPFAAPTTTPSIPPGADNLATLGGNNFGLPTGGLSNGCNNVPFTMSYTSDAPISIGGYLTSAGEQEYFPAESSGSASVEQCSTNPSVLIIIQAGPNASTVSCTTTMEGRTQESRTATGPYGLVYCYG